MLSIGSMSGGQGNYYAGLAREDYYTNGGEPPGTWFGKGAEKLGLSGQVKTEEFLEVFSGFKDGERLVQSAGKDNHRPGWDLTFSAPKSVSTAWSQAGKETGLEIRASHLSAVEKALEYVQDNAAWTRRGKAGCELERCDVVFASFEHGTSRAQDPQLHSHALLLNIAVREDGSTGTLETKAVYDLKMAAGAIYRAELTRQLQQRLGFEFEREKSWFEVKGVSKELAEEFSKRRREIEEALASKGFSSSRAAEIAAFETRGKKAHVGREELFRQWRAVGKEMGWSEEQLSEITKEHQPARDLGRGMKAVAAEAVAQITGQNSYFTERELVRRTAEESQTIGAGADAVIKAAKDLLADSKEIVRLGMRFNEPIYTTKEMLEVEKSLLKKVQEANERKWFSVKDDVLKNVQSGLTLSEEQAHALKTITRDSASIAAVVGIAGSGKTTLLKAAREAWEQSGFEVQGTSLGGKAARGLQEEAGIKSTTIAKILIDLGRGVRRFDEKTILVVDEAGMVGTRQMNSLVEAVTKDGAKLVLVGDPRQLQPIDAGGPFASIAERVKTATLTHIIRQREDWQKETVRDFSEGKSRAALAEYAKRGLVHVEKDRDGARKELLSLWKEEGTERPNKNLIVTATNLDAHALNREAQRLRAEGNFLRGDAAEVGGTKFYSGDRVLFTKRSVAMGVENGSLGTVKDVSKHLGKLTVTMDSGEEKTFSTKNYDSLKLGYAVTTHKGQGMTAENVFILTSETGMQDRELSYVQASRARGVTRFFATEAECGDNLSQLAKKMERSHRKELAVDALREKERERDHGMDISR